MNSIESRYEKSVDIAKRIHSQWDDNKYADATPDQYLKAYHEFNESSGYNDQMEYSNDLRKIKDFLEDEYTWKAIDADKLMRDAEKAFGTTTDFRLSGYILPNGKMLNMSSEGNKRDL